jgi:hypothetical protein
MSPKAKNPSLGDDLKMSPAAMSKAGKRRFNFATDVNGHQGSRVAMAKRNGKLTGICILLPHP